jgi:two-component sensor histidine kinase
MNILTKTVVALQGASDIPDVASLAKPDLYRRLRALIALVVIPMMILTVVAIVGVSRIAQERTAEGIMQTARSVMASTDAELKGHMGALRLLAGSPVLQTGDLGSFRSEAERFISTFPGARSNIVLNDSAGNILFSVLPMQRPLKRGNVTAVNEVFASKRTYVSDMYDGAVTGLPTFAVDTPVMKDGKVLFGLAFNPSRDIFFRILENLQLPDGWVISIFDRKYHHVARSPSLGQDRLTSGAESLQQEMRNNVEGIAQTTSLEGVKLLTAYTRSAESGWTVALGVPAKELSASVNRALLLTITLSAMFYAVAATVAWRMARAVTNAEAQRELLINELNHRVKNTLAGVQAVVSQTLRRTTDVQVVRSALQNRLMAMSRAHDVLSERNWTSVDLRELVKVILLAYEDMSAMHRVRIDGPLLVLTPRQALPLAMVVNELATNALKYGALSTPAGSLVVGWRRVDDGNLLFSWEESGGPPTTEPAAAGFGTFFMERAVVHELHGDITREYDAGGLKVKIKFPAGGESVK